MRKHLTCPSCGAPITNEVCQYCGAIFYDFANLNINEACYLRLRWMDKLFVFKAMPKDVSLEYGDSHPSHVYLDDAPLFTLPEIFPELNITFAVLQDDNGILAKAYQEEDDD